MLAFYPVTHTGLNTESHPESAVVRPLNRAKVPWFVDHLFRSKDDLKDHRLELISQEAERPDPTSLTNIYRSRKCTVVEVDPLIRCKDLYEGLCPFSVE